MDENRAIIDVLNRILDVEYTFIWYYPQFAERIAQKDKEAVRLLVGLGEASVRHADQTMERIHAFGGEPPLNIDKPPERDVIIILQAMLEKEKHAAWLYGQAAGVTDNAETKKWLLETMLVEEHHAHVVADILMRLASKPATGTSRPSQT